MGIIFLAQLGDSEQWKSIMAHVLVSIAFLTFLVIIAHHVRLKVSHCHFSRRLAFCRSNADFDVRSCEGLRGYDALNESSEDDDTLGTGKTMTPSHSLVGML